MEVLQRAVATVPFCRAGRPGCEQHIRKRRAVEAARAGQAIHVN